LCWRGLGPGAAGWRLSGSGLGQVVGQREEGFGGRRRLASGFRVRGGFGCRASYGSSTGLGGG
jgi:hypothetical protein